MDFETKRLPSESDYLAPDGSDIRLLPDMNGGGLCHCTLAPSKTSLAIRVEDRRGNLVFHPRKSPCIRPTHLTVLSIVESLGVMISM